MSSTHNRPPHGILLLTCPDRPGIVYAITELLADGGYNILHSQQFDSSSTGTFFMRVEFAAASGETIDFVELNERIAPLAQRLGMTYQLADSTRRMRVVIMVSKFAHCLNDLLFRHSIGELGIDVVAVVSNHPDLGRIADSFGVSFRHIPVTPESKPQAEQALLDLVRAEAVDLVILARYMQILSENLCKQLNGHAINIHHSMLPSFKGAKPYHQAHARGVKYIGATAHYVTTDLDEGPIIEQELIRVDHSLSPQDLAACGREAETKALARAVRWHSETRIVSVDNRTVVFQ
ncbi:formyltetrahydrofolate deformylase [Nocardia aobensis]|uniref:Formyltetrahydrofolate deformylase n=1 Tax=Nocardia aobensis TaxID=257277 RepID=A0ABW6PF33_9NOCA